MADRLPPPDPVLDAFVADLRARTPHRVPGFDPRDGGRAARVLLLLEKPGRHSTTVSRDNPTPTARAVAAFLAQAGLPRHETVLWNVAPAWNGTPAVTAAEVRAGLAETARLATRLGANPLTLMGLAGLGDLVATCSSPLSRNRTFGEKLGQGLTSEEIYASTRQVAEGAKSCASLRALAAHHGVDSPVAEYVDDVVAGRMTAQDMMDRTLARDTKAETD